MHHTHLSKHSHGADAACDDALLYHVKVVTVAQNGIAAEISRLLPDLTP